MSHQSTSHPQQVWLQYGTPKKGRIREKGAEKRRREQKREREKREEREGRGRVRKQNDKN